MNLSIPPPASVIPAHTHVVPPPASVIPTHASVIPAKAGIPPASDARLSGRPQTRNRKRGTRSTGYSTMFAHVQRTPGCVVFYYS